ncbi:hypothetical protein, partial [Rhodovulum adriaticum]
MFSIEFPATRPVLIAMRSRGDFGANIGWMRAAGLSVGLTDQLGSAFSALRVDPSCWGALLIHVDDFGGIDEVLEKLLILRRQVPNVPVILVSWRVARDDFGSERLPLADVTLRD